MSNAAYTRRGTDPASEPLLNADEGQQQQRQGQQQQQQQESGQLPLHAGGGAANGDGQPDTMAGIVKYSNFTGSAWAVQGLALLFAALVWGMILSNMSLTSLPLFGYHPLMQSLGLVLLSQSILVLQPTTAAGAKASALNVHQILNLLIVLPLFTAGAIIMWYLHEKSGGHFISWHGKLGFVVVVWAWIQAAIGAASVWFGGKALGGGQKAKAVWKWHRLSGYLLLPLFLFVFFLGATQTLWTQQHSSWLHRLAITLALVGVAVAGAARVRSSKLPKLGWN